MTTPDVRQMVLARHGLDAGAMGPTEVLRLPQPAVDEARTARPASARAEALHVRSDALAAAGITARFDDETATLLLSAPEDLAFRVIALPTAAAAPLATHATLPASAPASFVLAGSTGPLAVASVDPRSLQFSVVHGWPAPPIDAWIAGIDRSDRGVLEAGGTGPRPPESRWTATQLTGRIARLMRARGSEAAAIEARRWLRGIDAGQRALVERFAVVCARTLAARLARLQTALQPDDASLEETWAWACWERDDLEGLRVLLREAGAGAALAAALQAPDATGRAVRFSWPTGIDVHDERLQRVSEGDPGAWWGSTRGHVAWW